MTKRTLMVAAGALAAVSFALPWATIQALPKSLAPVDRQVIVVPPGGRVIVSSGSTAAGTGTGVSVAPTANTPPVASTRASAPAPPGA